MAETESAVTRPLPTAAVSATRAPRHGVVGFGLRFALGVALASLGACGPSSDDVVRTDSGGGGGELDVPAADGGGLRGDAERKKTPCGTDQDCAQSVAVAPCERAVCVLGSCKAKGEVDGADCEDGDLCTLKETCLGGTCMPHAAKSCDDGNPCTGDSCDPVDGSCAVTATDGACGSGAPCGMGLCEAGQCATVSAYVDAALEASVSVDGATGALAANAKRIAASAASAAGGAVGGALWLRRLNGAPVAYLSFAATRVDALAPHPAGGFVGVGATVGLGEGDDGAGATDGAAVRVSDDGEVLWMARYGIAGEDRLVAVDGRPDGGFVAVGLRTVANADEGAPMGALRQEGWLVVFASDGAQTVDYHYSSPEETALTAVAAHAGGAVAGGRQLVADKAATAIVLATSPVGKLLAVRQIVQAGPVGALTRLASGRVVAILAGGAGATGGPSSRLWIGDAELNPLVVAPLDAGFDDELHAIAPAPGGGSDGAGGLLVAGRCGSSGALAGLHDGAKGCVSRVSALGVLQWRRVLPKLALARRTLTVGDGFWTIGAGVDAGDGNPPAVRLARLDGFGYASCEAAGGCAGKAAAGCDDGDPCTLDGCVPGFGCTHLPAADGSACAPQSVCAQGACTSAP